MDINQSTRPAAVAGAFYSNDATILKQDIADLLGRVEDVESEIPKAVIAPHAGYIYSGKVAANVYAQFKTVQSSIKKIILLGPSHRVAFHGMAIPSVDYFATPLGKIKLDASLLATLKHFPHVIVSDQAHAEEHSLEVQLPFMQTVFDEFELLPIVVGQIDPEAVADLLNNVWGEDDTLIVVSSDLSHFLSYDQAVSQDQKTTEMIRQFQYHTIKGEDACGCHPMNGLLCLAQQKDLKVRLLAQNNSGDTAGDKRRVVGYGGYGFY
jgi:MEMO1 family protein